jgi:hypothetical protein
MTNLRVLRPSRSRLEPGDIFVLLPSSDRYLHGRVIFANTPRGLGPVPAANLVYIYAHESASEEPEIEELTHDRLLIPPVWTNRVGWSRGYFVTIMKKPLGRGDVLPRHCWTEVTGLPPRRRFVDEYRTELVGPVEPCGFWGLASYALIDDLISDALGMPRAPLSDADEQERKRSRSRSQFI